MIVYKVVGKNKCSSNWEMFRNNFPSNNNLPELRKKLIKLGWVKLYYKGRIINARKDSVGIICFKGVLDAEDFKRRYFTLKSAKIIKVEGLGEPTCPQYLYSNMGGGNLSEIDYLNNRKIAPSMPSPDGSIAFRSVKVLE